MATQQTGIFEEALKASSDITAIYYDDTRLRQELRPAANFGPYLTAMRSLMQANGGIQRIAAADPKVQATVEWQHRRGRIGAVDGTDAIALTAVDGDLVYAVGVIGVTAQTMHMPRIIETAARLPIATTGPPKTTDLLEVVQHLDRYGEDVSWCRTFREYHERSEALRMLDEESCALVLIDGPLYTQNLLTQQVARDGILAKMLTHSDRLIGFIKEMRTAKLLHFAGMALDEGEYWVIDEWRRLLAHRFDAAGRGHAEQTGAHQWLTGLTTRPEDWVRVVYRIRSRAFAFECHPDLVATGIAMLNSDITMSEAVNHELPFLLETADRLVRAQMAAATKAENLISDSDHYANLADEREFR